MIFIAMILGLSLFTGFVVELYKKYIRKDKSGTLENKLVAFAVSAVLGTTAYFATDFTGLPVVLNKSWALIPVFAIAVYLLQMPACMELWKPVVKKWISSKA